MTGRSDFLISPNRIGHCMHMHSSSEPPTRCPLYEKRVENLSSRIETGRRCTHSYNAVRADLGGKMEAYYDKEKKRWIFPDDDPNAEDPIAGPPPTAAELKKSTVKEEKAAPQDPLSAMMAPPSRAPRSAIPQKQNPVSNKLGMPPAPPKFAVFTPKPNS